MEKISKIIPATNRTTAVDMAKERPVRVGAPSFGAPIAQSDQDTRYSKSAVDAVPDAFGPMYGPDAKSIDRKYAQVVKDLEDKFFMKAKSPEAEPAEVVVIVPAAEEATGAPESIDVFA